MSVTFRQFSDFDSFFTFLVRSRERTYSVVHVNIRSIRKYWDELLIMLNMIQSTMDVIILTEINICDAPFFHAWLHKLFLHSARE